MTILDSLKNELHRLDATLQKDEKWVLAEITKGWKLLQEVGHTIEVDILGIFNYIHTHQTQITNGLQNALGILTAAGTVFAASTPAGAAITTALTAVNALNAATQVLGKGLVKGSTPLATAHNAFDALKQAQTAVNEVVRVAAAPPVALAAPPQ
jgi:hypothetical protein